MLAARKQDVAVCLSSVLKCSRREASKLSRETPTITEGSRERSSSGSDKWTRYCRTNQPGLSRTRADQVASRYGQSVQGNAICVEKFAPSTNVEEYRAVRPQHGFHSALLAMMPRRRIARLPILYEMMAFEIRYHGDFSLLDVRAPN